MATVNINFTKSILDKISPPATQFDTYRDTKQKGLILVVSRGGAKTFYFYGKIGGKPERVKLGSSPEMPVEFARKVAAKTKLQIDSGENPQQKRLAVKREMTLGDMFEEYMERYSKKHKKSWIYDQREVPKYLGHWFSRKLSSINNQEVRRLHETIADTNGIYQANRILERIRAIFNKGIEWGWEGTNPALKIKKYKEKSRDRFLQPEEVQTFMDALKDEENEVARDFIYMLLYTGARKSNVLQMRWEQISFQNKTWRIPETKNGEPHIVALSSFACEILEKRRNAEGGNSEWVFPGTGERGHLIDPKKAWNRLLAKSGIKNFRMHDLRRTLGSWQAAIGSGPYVIGKSLGHKSQQSTAIYARLNLDPVRQSVEMATSVMLNKMEA